MRKSANEKSDTIFNQEINYSRLYRRRDTWKHHEN